MLTGRDRIRIVPGGLTRVALKEGLAGGQFQPGRRHQRHLGVGRMSMLSRTADNLYWLARYVERAEYLARILEATQRLTAMPLAYVAATNEWESAVATAGCAAAFFAAHDEANETTVTDFLAFSPDNPSSMRSCLEIARTNARAVRTALTMEMWDAINGTWLELQKLRRRDRPRARSSRSSCAGCRSHRCASTARPTAPCCATTPTGSRGSACSWSAPTTPRASST